MLENRLAVYCIDAIVCIWQVVGISDDIYVREWADIEIQQIGVCPRRTSSN